MLFIPFGTFWRWSQLALAISILLIEYFCRGFLNAVFSLVPIKYLSSWGLIPSHFSVNGSPSISDDEKEFEMSTPDLIRNQGYHCEEHFTTTQDGFILGLQRIPRGAVPNDGASIDSIDDDDVEDTVDASNGGSKPAVLIIHGFMQSSEAWVCRKDAYNSLPLVLADAGYDVWLGNNRGNKYSQKHVSLSNDQEEFWNWSLDEIARHDVPAMIEYVLACNGGSGLVLIGFSQGTAQSWATLSSNPRIASKVKMFVALAPVSTVRGFSNPLIDSLARSRPDFISLLFGKRAFLPSTMFWRRVLPRDQLVDVMDYAVAFLFGWKGQCLDQAEKKLLYSHIYSFSSVKSVVHWFQIIQSGRFQMFDQSLLTGTAAHVVPAYQPGLIRCPVAVYYGGQDTLPNTRALLLSIPKHLLVEAHKEPDYEHLDFMWARDVGAKVYPRIVRTLADARSKGVF